MVILHPFLDAFPSKLARFVRPDVLFDVPLSVLRTVLRVVDNSVFSVEIEGEVGMVILHPFLDELPSNLGRFIRPDVLFDMLLSVLRTVLRVVDNSVFSVEIEGWLYFIHFLTHCLQT